MALRRWIDRHIGFAWSACVRTVAMPPRPRAGPRSYASGLVGYCCRPLPLLWHSVYVKNPAGDDQRQQKTDNTHCSFAATDPCSTACSTAGDASA